MKKLLPLVPLAVILMFLAPNGEAAKDNFACFDWSCTGSYPSTCTFNPGCSETNSGTPWRDAWTFGDSGSALLSPGSIATHVFTHPYPDVTLLKYHFGANSPSVTCNIVARNVIGPPQPLYGRCE